MLCRRLLQSLVQGDISKNQIPFIFGDIFFLAVEFPDSKVKKGVLEGAGSWFVHVKRGVTEAPLVVCCRLEKAGPGSDQCFRLILTVRTGLELEITLLEADPFGMKKSEEQ